MAAVAQLKAVLGMDSKEFKAGMKSATKDASTFQSNIKNVGAVIAGAFTVSAIVGMGKSLASWASTVSEAAQNTGILTSEMMALNELALQGGVDVNQMQMMLSKLQTKLYDAVDGNKEAVKSFEDMGLSISELVGLNPAQMLERVAKAAIDTGAPLQHLNEIFGERFGVKAVSMMKDLAENGLPEVGTQAALAADKIEYLGDMLDGVMERAKRTTISAAYEMAKGFQYMGAAVAGAYKAVDKKALGKGLLYGSASTAVIRAGKEAVKGAFAGATGAAFADSMGNKPKEDPGKDARDALKARLDATVKRQNDEAYQKYAEMNARQDEEKEKQESDRKNKRASLIAKWNSDRMKRYDIRRGGEERMARLQEQLTSLTNPQSGAATMNPDAMARIGGFFGGERAGFDVASKHMELTREIKEINKEMLRAQIETKEALARQRGEIN